MKMKKLEIENHYKPLEGNVDVIEFFRRQRGNNASIESSLFNIVKYAMRFDRKETDIPLEVVTKIEHYAARLRDAVTDREVLNLEEDLRSERFEVEDELLATGNFEEDGSQVRRAISIQRTKEEEEEERKAFEEIILTGGPDVLLQIQDVPTVPSVPPTRANVPVSVTFNIDVEDTQKESSVVPWTCAFTVSELLTICNVEHDPVALESFTDMQVAQLLSVAMHGALPIFLKGLQKSVKVAIEVSDTGFEIRVNIPSKLNEVQRIVGLASNATRSMVLSQIFS